MNYQQTLAYLFAQLPMYSRIGAAAYKADLDNTIALCNFIDNPQQHFKSIHIAGTNGKGSTSHMLAAVLQQAGYKTGLYTSPHLKDFRERIKIDGEMIAQQAVIEFVKKTKSITEEIQPSFFELTVAMAFDHFAKEKVDIAVIETGLGGRLDSTNIINPILSIITNISYDHMNLLGDTLEKIATEKAGIIKHNTPVVIGEASYVTKQIFINTADENKAAIHFAEEEYHVNAVQSNSQELTVEVSSIKNNIKSSFHSDLAGAYQAKNLCTVLSAIDILKQLNFAIGEEALKHALANVKSLTGLHGRWELIQHDPTVILDVGHNEEGIRAIISQLAITKYNQLHIVIGVVQDKEVEKVLSILPNTATYYFTQAQIPRALNAIELKKKARLQNLRGESYPDVNQAVQAAIRDAAPADLILVCGSVFVVGEVSLGS